MKTKIFFFTCILFITLFSGCGQMMEAEPTPTASGVTNPVTVTPDAVASPSVADDEESLIDAIGSNGTWIIVLTKDLTTDKELVLDGEYKNGKKDDDGNDIIQRKIALYTQDENRNITNRFTLAAPKLTINSPKASIQHGTFKGDLYVSAKDFELIDTKVEGNVYFTNEDAQSTFKLDEDSSISGNQEMKE